MGRRAGKAKRARARPGSRAPRADGLRLAERVKRARSHYQSGHHRDAERLLRGVLAHDPNNAAALHYLGLALRALGRTAEAEDPLHRAAAVHYERGDLEACEASCAALVELNPDDADVHHNMGKLLLDMGRVDAAVEAWREAVRCAPYSAEEHSGLGFALTLQGRPDEAIAAFQEALRIDPGYAPAHSNLGVAYSELGRFDAATESFRRALELDPGLGEALLGMTKARRFSVADQAEVERMEALLDRKGLSEEACTDLHFAMGKIHDDCGGFVRAFAHYRAANRSQRRSVAFDRRRHTDWVSRIVKRFDASFFAEHQGIGSASTRPIFIVGMPRSGTSLVEQIIASHPHAHGGGELSLMPELVASLPRRSGTGAPYPECVERLDSPMALALASHYMEGLNRISANAERVTDKLPANFLYLGLIAVLLPHARIVHCQRDPMDVCLSIYFQKFSRDHGYACDLADIAHYYRQYERLMDHWRGVLPLPVHHVRYETLVAQPEAETRRLIEFCALPWDARCLTSHKTERPVQTASSWQVRQPVYQGSVERWRRYAPYLEELCRGLGLGAGIREA